MFNLLEYLKKKPLLLAPMAGVTDYPFRSFMRDMNGGILTTELVSSFALVNGNKERTKRIAHIDSFQQPIGIQIFGEDPKILSEAAIQVEQMGASFVDLNLGCPVPKIVKKGAGSAILKNLSLLSKILKSIKNQISIPLTIKVRTGWDDKNKNSLDVAKVAHDAGCLWMTIHGRTRSQGYSGLADWNYIAWVKSQSPIPIIGNGDLVHPDQIQQIYHQTKCDGLMIGRGCLRNPWIFNEGYQRIHNISFNKTTAKDLLQTLYQHLDSFYEEKMTLIQFKKFVSWFSAGYPQSALFRKCIFQIKEKHAVMKMALDYFEKWNHTKKEEATYEPFLLQGHG